MRGAICVLMALASTACGAEQVLLAVLKGSGEVGFFSLSGQLQGTVKVGQQPAEIAVSPDGKFAYVSDYGLPPPAGKGGNTVSIIDLAARKRVGSISTGKYRRVHGLSVDHRTGYLGVTAEAPDRILHIDPQGRKVIRHFDTKGRISHMVTLPPGKSGAEFAFVSNAGLSSVTVVQLTTGLVKSIPAGERPEGSVLSRDGKELYVCNRDSANITVIDVERQAAIGEIRTGKGPVRGAITPDGSTLVYAASQDGAVEFADLSRRRVATSVKVDGQPVSITLSPDGKLAFAALEGKDKIAVVSVPERKLLRVIDAPKASAPDGLAVVMLP